MAINLICTSMLSLLLLMEYATGSAILSPQGNYIVFQSHIPATFMCSGDGTIAVWTFNGNPTNGSEVTIAPIDPALGAIVPSNLSIIPNITYNNTQVACGVFNFLTFNTFRSPPTLLTIQGTLNAPSSFTVNKSDTSNTTFLLSWGAPFSLNVTNSPDIFYYILCANITIYGCKTIHSDLNCTFPRTCNSSVDFTDPSLNGTNGGQNKTVMDYGDPIQFTFFAVNGAGNGSKATSTLILKIESGDNLSSSQTDPRLMETVSIATLPTDLKQSTSNVAMYAVPVAVCAAILIIIIIIISLVITIKSVGTKINPSSVVVTLSSYTHHEEYNIAPTLLSPSQQKEGETYAISYKDVECQPIISITAPHQEVPYSEVKHPHNESQSEENRYTEVVCHPIISIPASQQEVHYSEVTQATSGTLHPCVDHQSKEERKEKVNCNMRQASMHSSENENESKLNYGSVAFAADIEADSAWCQPPDPEVQAKNSQILLNQFVVPKCYPSNKDKTAQRVVDDQYSDCFQLVNNLQPFKEMLFHEYEETICDSNELTCERSERCFKRALWNQERSVTNFSIATYKHTCMILGIAPIIPQDIANISATVLVHEANLIEDDHTNLLKTEAGKERPAGKQKCSLMTSLLCS